MEIDWRRKAACDVIANLPEDFDDAMKVLEFAAIFLERMAHHQKQEEMVPDYHASRVVPFRNLAKV